MLSIYECLHLSWCHLLYQEVTQKILEAVGNIAGSSLEQTSWLSRNLEVKAQPQISLDESNVEDELCGKRIIWTN